MTEKTRHNMAPMMMMMMMSLILVAIVTTAKGEPYTCKEKESCDSKVDKYSFLINCGCDKSCVAIGDCCSDYRDYHHNDINQKGIATKPECISMPFITSPYSSKIGLAVNIAMVRRCPTDFGDAYIKKQCESLEDNLPFSASNIISNFTFFVPVLGKSSNVLFANVFCAICNGEAKSSFLDVDFQNRRPMSIEKFLGIKDLTKFRLTFPRTRITMSHENYTPRPCRIPVDTCAKSWPEDDTTILCRESATSYVYNRMNSSIYKNKYCAICNYAEEDNVTCQDPRSYFGNLNGVHLYPYSILFDLNTGTIASQNTTDNVMVTTAIHHKEKNCHHHEIYDPFHRDCINLYCPGRSADCNHNKMLINDKSGSHHESLNMGSSICGSSWSLYILTVLGLVYTTRFSLSLWENI